MLYVGIAPDKPGKRISRQTVRSRVRYHLQGNAEGSTLRRTLGILLAEKSGFPLRRVGSGHRMTLTHLGEMAGRLVRAKLFGLLARARPAVGVRKGSY